MEKLIAFFAKRHLLTNLIMASVFIGGAFAWQQMQKEEWPDITFDRVRVSTAYPGAPAEDVEYFVTKPIEEEVRGIDGVYEVESSSSVGSSNVTIQLEKNFPNIDEVITEIRNAVAGVDLPNDIINDPNVRVFRSSKKAILDIGIYNENKNILDVDSRRELQQIALALENQLLSSDVVNSVNKDGYLQEEIQIKTYPDRLLKYEIPFNTVMSEIQDNNVRQPAGSIETKREPKVTILSELDSTEKLNDLIIQGGFEGKVIRLGEVSDVKQAYEKNSSVTKINGYEGIMFSVVKNPSSGILVALDEVTEVVKRFRKNSLEGSSIKAVFLDDESIDIRNRLKIIASNGIIGFVLILGTLFFFLSKRAGFWVAMGIPFTFCFTLICSWLFGFTINGMTLAAVIIVMGIVVDDAIVVAENIARYIQQGMDEEEAAIKGTNEIILPVVASIVTTCVAFVPLYFFTGRYGSFIEHIPPIIFLMLGASLIESFLVLPGHMNIKSPFKSKNKLTQANIVKPKEHWFARIENKYGRLLEKALPYKYIIFVGFIMLMLCAGWLATSQMKFVMFPNEETRDLVLSGEAPKGSTKYETAEMTQQIEKIIEPYYGKEVVGMRTEVARSRRGGDVQDNRFRMIIEIVPKEKRKKSADQLVKIFKDKIDKLEGFEKVKFEKSRWGSDSGSPIELIIQQNNDQIRDTVAADLVKQMNTSGKLINAEVGEELKVPEYRIEINRERVKRLSINPGDVASTFRAALEGKVLYEFSNGDEDVQVRFTVVDSSKDDIEKILDLPVENKGNYLVPLRDIVSVTKVESRNAINRKDLRRTTIIDADIPKDSKITPLDAASYLEEEVFPGILAKYPSTTLSFGGEILDTRESQNDFSNAITMVLILIYIILAILFNSMFKPFMIILTIPFGVVGIIFAFYLHGKILFGFYAAVGALGLAGVIINDAIIMLSKLSREYNESQEQKESNRQIAQIAQTRLRAVILTTLTTVVGVLPTAYGLAGFDATLAEMMLALAWGLVFGTLITLLLIPCVYALGKDLKYAFSK